jgi:glycerophosphoryl diester phosphodiesterase
VNREAARMLPIRTSTGVLNVWYKLTNRRCSTCARRLTLHPYREATAACWRSRWAFVQFALFFRLLEALLLLPAMSLAGRALTGHTVIDSTDVVRFVLSPRGFLACLLAATVLVTLRLVEHAGLSAIALGAIERSRVTATAALNVVLGQLSQCLGVAGWLVAVGLLLAAPPAAVAGLWARRLLPRHDINYYLAEWPGDFVTAVATVAIVAAPFAVASIWLAVRWQLVIQVLLCEPVGSRAALETSARLLRRNWRRAALAWLATTAVVFGLGSLAAAAGRGCAWIAAQVGDDAMHGQIALLAILLTAHTALSALVTLPGSCFSACVFVVLYRDRRMAVDGHFEVPFGETAHPAAEPADKRWRWLPAAACLCMAAFVLASSVLSLWELDVDRPVAVTAHRGGTMHAVENTLDAIREAIDVAAQFAEIDVQMSRDGVLVVTHDSDFSRQAGVVAKVWELTYDEIRAIRLRGGTSTFPVEGQVPTLDDVLDLARGRIHLNIELKYYGDHQPRLAQRVIESIRQRDMGQSVIVQSLHYPGLKEVRNIAPEVPIGYLFSFNAREPKRLDVDFLSVHVSRVNAKFIHAAHRRGQQVHAWTVDKPDEMTRLIDLGADNLITNRPREALELVKQQQERSRPERALRRVRLWLME